LQLGRHDKSTGVSSRDGSFRSVAANVGQKEERIMLIISTLGFAFALAFFVYSFDHFMGAGDTAFLTATMAKIRN
jgi:Flp pilus assembly protein protease CpaA